MPSMLFADMLNSMLERLPLSKNELIRQSGINRSTFFKFLKGERLPNEEQMRILLAIAHFPEEDRKKLVKVFEQEHYGYLAYRNIELVRQFMVSATYSTDRMTAGIQSLLPVETEESDEIWRGVTTVRHAMVQFLNRVRQEEGQPIYAFLPLFEARTLVESRVLTAKGRKTRLLFSFPDAFDDIDTHIAPNVRYLLPLVFAPNINVSYYYSASDLEAGLGLLYPYYFLTEKEAFFISARFNRAFIGRDEQIIRILRTEFEEKMLFMDEITHPHQSIEEVSTSILRETKENDIVLVNPAPALTFLATEELIQTYAHESQDTFIPYCRAMQSRHYKEIIPVEGLQKMVTSCALTGFGVTVQFSREELHRILLRLKERLGTTLFLADSKKMTTPEHWGVFLVSGKAIHLMPYNNSLDTVGIREKNLVEAFTQSFETNLDYFTLSPEVANRTLDTYITQTG